MFIPLKRCVLLLFSVLLCNTPGWAFDREQVLAHLSNLPGVSGFETPVQQAWIAYLKQLHQPYVVDRLGNIISEIKGQHPLLRVLIMGHMDEIGFLTRDIDDRGFIRVIALGGWLDSVLWSEPWLIHTPTRRIPAISGMDPPHVLNDFTKSPPVSRQQFFLDTGFSKKKIMQLGVRPGLAVTPDVKFKVFANGKLYLGKAFDDRAGLTVMLGIMESIQRHPELFDHVDIFFAATVQEEVGMRGANVLAQRIKPDVVLNLEAGIAHDYPQQFSSSASPVLGKGPALFVYDGSMLPSESLLAFIYQTAQQQKIPTQWELETAYGQDGASVQRTALGAHVINIGIPVRYAHSHYGLISRTDLVHTEHLLLATLKTLRGCAQLQQACVTSDETHKQGR